MLFPTITFAVFFVVVFVVHTGVASYASVPARSAAAATLWKLMIVGASYVFYGWWNWRYCALLAGSTVVNWLLAHAVHRARPQDQRLIIGLVVGCNLGLLSVFKYYDFLLETLDRGWNGFGALPALDVLVPIGISFFTFQAMSYVIDVHRKEITPRSLLDFATYLSFFPQLVAGPIVRATEFLPQLDRHTMFRNVDLTRATWLIGRGLFKKVVVATYLAESVVDPVFAAPGEYGRLEILQAMYGYSLQIYADFSGYTDMAIGFALLLGFQFPVNFDRPYRARSIQEFWRRWHMTLSRWLRDYLYISLGGNRKGKLLIYRNLLLTMVLGGLWHGAAWTFVAWGIAHGVLLAAGRWIQDRNAGSERERPYPSWASHSRDTFQWLVTFNLVTLTWVLFRADSFTKVGEMLTGLATASSSGSLNLTACALIGAGIVTQLSPERAGERIYRAYARLDTALQSAAAGAWVLLVALLTPQGVAPFIYFQF